MPATDPRYDRFAGTAAVIAGIGGFVYSLAFIGGVVLGRAPALGGTTAAIALLIGGLLSVVVLVALYGRVRGVSATFALLGLGLGLAGAVGAAIHGGYDLANVLHPPLADVLAKNDLPSPVDPRGLLTFGFAGLGLLVLSWLLGGIAEPAGRLPTLGSVVGILLVLVYLGRLIILSPTNPLVAGPAALLGFILNPLFYISLGRWLRQSAE